MAKVKVIHHNVFESIAKLMEERAGKSAALIQREVIKKISKPGPPRSSPGEPPHVDGGQLRQSIQATTVREGNTVYGTVTSNLEYAEHLEYGTSKMEARPFMRSTVAEHTAAIRDIMWNRGKV